MKLRALNFKVIKVVNGVDNPRKILYKYINKELLMMKIESLIWIITCTNIFLYTCVQSAGPQSHHLYIRRSHQVVEEDGDSVSKTCFFSELNEQNCI